MLRLNRNFYLLHNTISETVTHYDDPYRLVAWLLGKKTGHLIVYVVKGDRAKLLLISADVSEFQRELLATMNSL